MWILREAREIASAGRPLAGSECATGSGGALARPTFTPKRGAFIAEKRRVVGALSGVSAMCEASVSLTLSAVSAAA